MSARILDGRTVASRLWRDLSDRIADLHERTGATPRLAIVRLDARGPSAVYASSVWRAARSVGVEAIEVAPPEGVALSDLAARIGALNRDPSIAGIVVAQPVPSHLDPNAVVALIDPAKDVDGATPLNAGRIARGERTFVPATALAVMAILRSYQIPIASKRAVVIGRSAVVGRPVAALLLAADATVVVCHRRTRNLARETRRADILVVAAGVPGLVRAEMVNRSAVVIDCGINTTDAGIVGDVDFAAVRPVVTAITPVPGGVGPVTTMMLLQQTVDAAERAESEDEPALDRYALPERAPAPAKPER
ncbi:MAG TPA: bifunctional 5,10-methylenetetrahydrofolate dehydrogenase/5,10-methenyltetrahydrofolate cyclohydrolase [Candidatus Limnocylindria bacterium]|nr:bifunctional 5,10-methylenetetrahydrofolate dehydrogenase/5,10-methenyltetrahydrofolate cyclohydrolase [Candidatus Limnocylindria bacterium]